MIELHALFKGRVQGVGFRYTITNLADQLGVKGTVKNLPNGMVEVYAQGPREVLDLLLAKLKEQPGLGEIDSIDTSYREPGKVYEGFKTIY